MKRYREWMPEQSFLLAPSPRDWLPEGHLAFLILDVVSELDLSAIDGAVQSKDPRGERPYAPRVMVALLLYGYATGIFSSRRIGRATFEDVAFRVIAGDCHPHFTRISAFRRTHLDALKGLFFEVLKLCQRAGMVKLGHVALDGTKIQGNASKHKAMSYERMNKEEQRLACEISDLLELAATTDAEEDLKFGEEEEPLDIPNELKRREDRLSKIREAKAALEEEARRARGRTLREQAEHHAEVAGAHPNETARKRAAALAKNRTCDAERMLQGLPPEEGSRPQAGATTSQGLTTHRVPATPEGKPKPTAQRNFTDSDSRIMERDSTFLQGYNCQIAVDEERQVIVAYGVTNQAPDTEHLGPMLEQVVATCGRAPSVLTADAGYWREDHEETGDRFGTNVLIALQPAHRPSEEEICDPSQQTPRVRMARKLATSGGRRSYVRRKATVEPVYGQIKEVRKFRRFSLRGLPKVIGEWALICTTHNLLKLLRYRSETRNSFAST